MRAFGREIIAVLMSFALLGSSCSHRGSLNSEADALEDANGESAALDPALDETAEPKEETPEDVSAADADVLSPALIPIPVSDLPVEMNDRVMGWIEYFTGRGRPIFSKWLERQARIEPYLKQVLKEHNLPEDLVYLSMIESGFNPKAFSRAKASGLWQFMPATGRRYGLQVNDWIDERRDYEKASHAAAKHLQDLYAEFNDWYLAMAAYNAGSRKVQKAIIRHDTRDYWALANVRRPYLRAETRNYVPKLLAALIISKQRERFGFEPAGAFSLAELQDLDSLTFGANSEYVEVSEATDLAVIAECAGVDAETIRDLNPEIRHHFTPPGVQAYAVRVPAGTKEQFLAEFEKRPKERRVTFARHVLKSGQTLSHVAQKYGTSVQAIMKLNNLRNPRALRAGRSILIPVRVSSGNHLISSLGEKSLKMPADLDDSKRVKHVVKSGDTLWSLSQQYRVSIASLQRWNAKKRQSRIRPGEVLTIYLPQAS